jgi:membrane protein
VFKKARAFLKSGLWDTPVKKSARLKRAALRFLKIFMFSLRKMSQDQLFIRASALAFFSVLAVVPLAALVFGVAKGFGLQDVLTKQLQDVLALPGEVESLILDFAQTTLRQARGGLIAGLGVVFLFLSVALALGTVEESFNKIWGIPKGRRLSVKIRDYSSLIFVGTVLLLVSLSLTVAIAEIPSVFGSLNKAVFFLLSLAPYALVWLLFAALIMVMPNRRVGFKAGLFAGVVSGTLYQLILNFYIRLQVTVSLYNAIYGSLAALPLFLIWLQTSWICVLFGAEISFAFENAETMGLPAPGAEISVRDQRLILLSIVARVVKRFRDPGGRPPSSGDIAGELGLSRPLVERMLDGLVESGLISKTMAEGRDTPGFQPGLPCESLTVSRVLRTLDEKGTPGLTLKDNSSLRKIKKVLGESERLFEESSANVKVEDLN